MQLLRMLQLLLEQLTLLLEKNIVLSFGSEIIEYRTARCTKRTYNVGTSSLSAPLRRAAYPIRQVAPSLPPRAHCSTATRPAPT